MKFGGTSVGTAARIKNVAALVSSVPSCPFVVLSAMSGVTNSLVEIVGYLYNRNPDGARETIKRLESKHLQVAKELLKDSSEAFVTISAMPVSSSQYPPQNSPGSMGYPKSMGKGPCSVSGRETLLPLTYWTESC